MKTILLALILSLVALPAMAAIKFGTRVFVVKGFYEGCSGMVVDTEKDYEVNRLKYRVDLICKDADGVDHILTESFFLNEIEKASSARLTCTNKSCDNR